MVDVLDMIIHHGSEPGNETALRREIAAHIDYLRSSVQPGARELVREVESAVQECSDEVFTFTHENHCRIHYKHWQWDAGFFETASILELRKRAEVRRAAGGNGKVRLFFLDGVSPFTDIGSLQATCGGETLFQVASQFNCLESVGDFVAPVASYFRDPTQGPRASISAFPATMLRHYQAPGDGGERFVQTTQGRQINLLADACDPHIVKSGYLTGANIGDPEGFVNQLDVNFNKICAGVHGNIQVVYGHNWDGSVDAEYTKPIAQVFTSTLAGGGYGGEKLPLPLFRGICQQLLRAAYLSTLLAAISLEKRRVVLTLIGGGVFGNCFEDIWDAIVWAVREADSLLAFDLDIIVNGYDVRSHVDIDRVVKPDISLYNGWIITLDDSGLVRIS